MKDGSLPTVHVHLLMFACYIFLQILQCRNYHKTLIAINEENYHHELNGPRQANLVLIAYASSEGSGEPAHQCSLARTSATRSYKQ